MIDGKLGENTRKAIAAFSEMKGLDPTEQVNDNSGVRSSKPIEPALTCYKITEKETRGPFSKEIPEDYRDKAAWTGLAIQAPKSFLLRNST